jgi:hypothetical protein
MIIGALQAPQNMSPLRTYLFCFPATAPRAVELDGGRVDVQPCQVFGYRTASAAANRRRASRSNDSKAVAGPRARRSSTKGAQLVERARGLVGPRADSRRNA